MVWIILIVVIAFILYAIIKSNNESAENIVNSVYEKKPDDLDRIYYNSQQASETNHKLNSPSLQEEMKKYWKMPAHSPNEKGFYLLFDTETTGLPKRRDASPKDFNNWPYIVDIAWFVIDEIGRQVESAHYIIKQNVSIPIEASNIHHITTAKMRSEGIDPKEVLTQFAESIKNCEYIISHNISFDVPILECEMLRNNVDYDLSGKKMLCTMNTGRSFCRVYDKKGHPKNPTLSELFGELHFNFPYVKIEPAHQALADTLLLYHCFMSMLSRDPYFLKKAIVYQPYNEKGYIYNYLNILEDKNEAYESPNSTYILPLTDKKLFTYFPSPDFKKEEVLLTGMSDKERLWFMIGKLNGKVVKSVTVKLGVVVLGPAPGLVKLKKISEKIKAGAQIIAITDIQLELLYLRLTKN